jgi:hypothetical protein
MADVEHLERALQGVEVWNRWRDRRPAVRPDLCRADLAGARLFGANLAGTDLRAAILRMANLRQAMLLRADLSEANLDKADLVEADLREAGLSCALLREASLHRANLEEADLRGADLAWADLTDANLRRANLSGARLEEADLRGADLRGAVLAGAGLAGARMGLTILDAVDLSAAQGLEHVRHLGPSTIGVDALYPSGGRIPAAFLHGAGVAEAFIAAPLGRWPAYRSCFLSYSTRDAGFAERLHADLERRGACVWRAPHGLQVGDRIRDALDEAVSTHDTLCVILSAHSTPSRWLGREVAAALEAEQRRPGKARLLPLVLDDSLSGAEGRWAAALRNGHPVADFRAWQEPLAYAAALEELLRALQA